MFLPRHAPAGVTSAIPQRPVQAESVSGSVVVLLVDDEPAVRSVAAETLRDLGYIVLEADDGAAALRVLEQSDLPAIDILVTDVGLPGGLNGRQLADAVRTRWPSLPVLFITGYAGSALEGQIAPKMSILRKPFSLGELAAKLERMRADDWT